MSEHFLLMSKRKAHEPFPLDTRSPPCKLAFAQTVRACADGCAARPLAALRKSHVCAAACVGWFIGIKSVEGFGRRLAISPYEYRR